MKISCDVITQQEHNSNWITIIDWSEAVKSGAFRKLILKDWLSPFIGKAHCDVEQLDVVIR